MSGTPETDAAVMAAGGDWSYPLRECSRRLERERDEAVEDCKNSRQSLAVALEELDEAREAAHSFRSFYYAKTGVNKGGCAFPWEETK